MRQLLPILFLLVVGCAGQNQYVSKDPLVNAEKATVIAEATFNTLFTLEKQNHDLVVKYAPAVHVGVNSLRVRALPLLQSALRVTAAYRQSSSPQNRESLVAILKTLEAATNEAITYKTQILSAKGQ